MAKIPAVSIVIPTLEREDDLTECLKSLHAQTVQDFEVITLRERGPLSLLRNRGLHQARGRVVCFIDDDVRCPKDWLAHLLGTLRTPGVAGVTGPALIPGEFQRQRDLFRHRSLKRFHDLLFLDHGNPAHIHRSGAASIFPEDTGYHGPCHYLEACNQAYRTKALRAVGGFDEAYGGVGDWSEPDVGLRLRQRFGPACLRYEPGCALTHLPSRSGAFLLRASDARQRLANARLFAARWVRPSWRARTYRGFLWSYYVGWPKMSHWSR